MAKEVKEEKWESFVVPGRKVKSVSFAAGQAVQVGTSSLSGLNVHHTPDIAKLRSDIVYNGSGIEFKFEAKANEIVEVFVPMSVIKTFIFMDIKPKE